MTKYYYGFRYFSGYSCTTGEPNAITGRLSIAGECKVFSDKDQLDNWIEKRDLYKPCGLGGGEREQVNKEELRRLCLGMSAAAFVEMLDYEVNQCVS